MTKKNYLETLKSVLGRSIIDYYPKTNFPRGQFPGAYCEGEIIRGTIIQGKIVRGGNFPLGQLLGHTFQLIFFACVLVTDGRIGSSNHFTPAKLTVCQDFS